MKIKSANEIDTRAEALVAENKELERQREQLTDRLAAMRTKNMMAGVKHLNGVNILTAQLDGVSAANLKTVADNAKAQMTSGVIVLVSTDNDKITFVAMAMPEAVRKRCTLRQNHKRNYRNLRRTRRRQARYGTGRRYRCTQD